MNAQGTATTRERFKRRRLPSTLGLHINDLLDEAAALRSRRDFDAASFSELDPVADQVMQDLLQAVLIRADRPGTSAQR